MSQLISGDLNFMERFERIALGFVLILFVLLQTGPLGNLSYLLLIAIYPSITGILGWDPVYHIVAANKFRFITRKESRQPITTTHNATHTWQ